MEQADYLDEVVARAIAPPTAVVAAEQTACSPAVNLPAAGVIVLPGGDVVTLTAGAQFKPACTPVDKPAIIAQGGGITTGENNSTTDPNDTSSITTNDLRDPFYGSTFPQCYALAATTVVSYTLVIMLLITPRSFLDGGVVVLGRRRFTDGGAGGRDIGGRPWLQKVAALTVAISLTIASVNTFGWAEYQYNLGQDDARNLQNWVMGSTELKAISIISETFLWLAQAQTLTRLFPRQREKIIIKWTAFALVSLDVIFQSLDSFLYTTVGGNRPQNFTEAIPALSYLFQLTLGVLYAAWVIYYAIMKRRYAFYHARMKNIFLLATLALLAIMVPVVFFILDISQPDFTGWGAYVRWVGAAAASTIVWEWVERIEALEREEKKDGILGREVFDGDEMMEITASDHNWPRRRRPRNGNDDDEEGGGNEENGGGHRGRGAALKGNIWPHMSSIAARYRTRSGAREGSGDNDDHDYDEDGNARGGTGPGPPNNTRTGVSGLFQPPLWPARPGPAVTPVSRTDTTSADSTVYAIRYHPLTETSGASSSPPVPVPLGQPSRPRSNSGDSSRHSAHSGSPPDPPPPQSTTNTTPGTGESPAQGASSASASAAQRWRRVSSLRRSTSANARTATTPTAVGSSSGGGGGGHETRGGVLEVVDERVVMPSRGAADEGRRWDLKGRLEDFAMTQAERLRERIKPAPDTSNLPVMVIPAPRRRGAALAQVLEENERVAQGEGSAAVDGRDRPPRTTIASAESSGSAPPGDGEQQLRPPLSRRQTGEASRSRSGSGSGLRSGAVSPRIRSGETPPAEGGSAGP